MTEPTETRLREYLIERQKTYSNEKDNIIIPEENKQHIEDIWFVFFTLRLMHSLILQIIHITNVFLI